MARNKNGQGRGWFGDSEGHAKAGKQGGRATAQSHDSSFYERIGHDGGEASPMQFKEGDDRTRQAGAAGGRARRKRQS